MGKKLNISVVAIMPTFNQAEFIEAAMDSVKPQVNELLVYDDGSTDMTMAILLDRDDVHAMGAWKNGGTARAINAGHASIDLNADWLTWVSSDNTYEPHWMATLKAQIADDVGVVYSSFWFEKPGRKPRLHSTPYDPTRLIADQNCFFGPSFIIRADIWQQHRGKISHDYDNWLRVEEACWAAALRIVHVPEPLCHYNAHDKRVTVTRRDQYDADHWQQEAIRRRNRSGRTGPRNPSQ